MSSKLLHIATDESSVRPRRRTRRHALYCLVREVLMSAVLSRHARRGLAQSPNPPSAPIKWGFGSSARMSAIRTMAGTASVKPFSVPIPPKCSSTGTRLNTPRTTKPGLRSVPSPSRSSKTSSTTPTTRYRRSRHRTGRAGCRRTATQSCSRSRTPTVCGSTN